MSLLPLAVLLLLGGCARWTPANQSDPLPTLPPQAAAADCVTLEIQFVRLPGERREALADIWASVDEQQIPAALRARLLDNGFRCGVIGTQLPEKLTELIAPPEDAQQPADDQPGILRAATRIENDLPGEVRQVRCRPGQRAEIISSGAREKLIALINDGDGVRGETYENAQCVLALQSHPEAAGVHLEITPEIQHGQAKTRWTGQSGMFRQVTSKDKQQFSDLQIDVHLAPGQTVLLSTTPEAKGLGSDFLTNTEGAKPVEKLLLIRLAQAAPDALFDETD